MTKYIDRRVCGTDLEGLGEYQTRWNRYEYKCPECGKWSGGSDVTLLTGTDAAGDELHATYCPTCAALIAAEMGAA